MDWLFKGCCQGMVCYYLWRPQRRRRRASYNGGLQHEEESYGSCASPSEQDVPVTSPPAPPPPTSSRLPSPLYGQEVTKGGSREDDAVSLFFFYGKEKWKKNSIPFFFRVYIFWSDSMQIKCQET